MYIYIVIIIITIITIIIIYIYHTHMYIIYRYMMVHVHSCAEVPTISHHLPVPQYALLPWPNFPDGVLEGGAGAQKI